MVGLSLAFVPIFESWPSPRLLTRSWCLFEFYHAIKQKKRVEPALLSTVAEMIDAGFAKHAVEKEMPYGQHSWAYGVEKWQDWTATPKQLELIERVDVSIAQARYAEDKERIDRSVREDLGFERMNRMLRDELVAHLYTARCVARKESTYTRDEVSAIFNW
eukprot:COSAG02_NODE_14871_length_1227_cov_5.310284_2_plen_161_part_00